MKRIPDIITEPKKTNTKGKKEHRIIYHNKNKTRILDPRTLPKNKIKRKNKNHKSMKKKDHSIIKEYIQ